MTTDLVDLVAGWARRRPDARAVTVTDTAAQVTAHATYCELDLGARSVASGLRAAVEPGDRVLLACTTGLDYVLGLLGCWYAGVIAVPIGLSDQSRSPSAAMAGRIARVVKDCDPAVVLTAASTPTSVFPTLRALVVTELAAGPRSGWRPPPADPDRPALLQYTSGSTSSPKGVIVTHANILSNVADACAAIDADALAAGEFRLVSWLPLYHDMGLFQLISALHQGGHIRLMPPLAFLLRPSAWLAALAEDRAFAATAPDFGYALSADRGAKEADQLDLSSVHALFNGSEPVHRSTIDHFTATFADTKLDPEAFLPCYGLAEAVAFVTGMRRPGDARYLAVDPDVLESTGAAAPPAATGSVRQLVGCGRPIGRIDLRIVDPDTHRPCADRQAGEIWIAGPNVSPGYWNNPDQTRAKFGARIAGAAPLYLRTGDIGLLDDGQLYVLGRIDDMITIDGRNHFPQDIESTVADCHPGLALDAVAAFGYPDQGRTRLAIAAETDLEVSDRRLKLAIRTAVAEEHGVQARRIVLVPPGALPRTTSGKLRRHQCRESL